MNAHITIPCLWVQLLLKVPKPMCRHRSRSIKRKRCLNGVNLVWKYRRGRKKNRFMEILRIKLNLSKPNPKKVCYRPETRIIMVIKSTPMLLRSMPVQGFRYSTRNGIVTKLPIPMSIHPVIQKKRRLHRVDGLWISLGSFLEAWRNFQMKIGCN